ncbi:GNAT family N-acetyltransferase [Nitrosomonas sp.]|uniref:GNAT family N-acetyltransferase n=1 Tax=Nitrosomonas sp. TaxID=42353 RepID=UPI0025F7FE49|nr:GNAT family N-acetyltransferase [Nitrosomonas sp.]MCC6916315.1 GNAT family N-acetyltransferase [Nitrosomonas sp.]
MKFIACPAEGDVIAVLEKLQPANPFATVAYFESMRLLGYSIWVVGLQDSASKLVYGCGAFIKKGKLNSTLQITSLPNLGVDSHVFWQGLRDFSRRGGITQLELGTYASPYGTDPPLFDRRCTRKKRCEFILDISGDLAEMLSSNHRRNVKKAQKAGIVVKQTRSAEAAVVHHELMNQSMDRRRSRGEKISLDGPSPEIAAILKSGAGELFQAIHEGSVLSSILVLQAAGGSYYQSAGTSPDGMAVGASHFLIHSITIKLKSEGAYIFNLGGADEDSTLGRFKKGFGASHIPLFSASCYVGPDWRYGIGRVLELIRSDRKMLLHLFAGGWSRMLIYAADAAASSTLESVDWEFRALTDEDLRNITTTDPLFRTRQMGRLERFGCSYAYGVFADGQIAHVSWLLPAAAMNKDLPRVICASEDVAEITACETLSEFRGRGIYGFAIRNLLGLARENGVQRVFMKTLSGNRASQSGIEKAGLKRVGSAILITLPLTRRQVIWRRFR